MVGMRQYLRPNCARVYWEDFHGARGADQIWIGHILSAFRNSHLKIYVDGELQKDPRYGGGGTFMWVQVPGEGKYYFLLSLHGFEGPVPPPAGRFDGHVLESHAGARAVRIESNHTYGFGMQRPVYAMGPKPPGGMKR
jgi:hypothetical protein